MFLIEITKSWEIAKSCRWLAADFGRALERWRQRRALEDLDDHLLKDIGISRAEALTEAGRSFWDRADAMAQEKERPVRRRPSHPPLVAFSENDSASRASPSGSRNRPRLGAATMRGKSR